MSDDHRHLHVGNRASKGERHSMDVSTLLFHGGKLYSGSDDGKIKVWDMNMKLLGQIKAHPCSVFSLAASEEQLYSCSNEGTIKTFDLNTLKELKTVVRDEKIEYWKLFYSDGYLYSGDNFGNIIIWKHGTEVGVTNIAEPIKDLVVSGKHVFTVKDTDLVVTELNLDHVYMDEEAHLQVGYAIKADHMGRFPLALIGDKYVACAERDGKDVIVIENNPHTNFRQFATIEGSHQMLINAIAGVDWKGKTYLFTGGWDKKFRKFRFEEDIIKIDCTSEVDFVINSIAVGENGDLYAGGSEGNVMRLDIE